MFTLEPSEAFSRHHNMSTYLSTYLCCTKICKRWDYACNSDGQYRRSIVARIEKIYQLNAKRC